MIIRSKNGKNAKTRFEEFLNEDIFSRLKKIFGRNF
jgi:hypothetical protein